MNLYQTYPMFKVLPICVCDFKGKKISKVKVNITCPMVSYE